ncbi:MAG: ribosome hibernation-promoting factor, HPF/YfiA family [Actinomycetota bacterium]
MDVVVKGRGTRVTDRIRGSAEHKLARLERMEPRVTRIEVQIIAEPSRAKVRTRRVEAALQTARKTFRAHAEADDVDSAVDRLVDKLERQLRDHHSKRRARLGAGAKGVRSAELAGEPEPEDED